MRCYHPPPTLLSIALACTLGGTGHAQETPAGSVTSLADEYFQAFIESFPIVALFLGVPDAANDRVDDNSLTAVREWQAKEDRWYAALLKIDTTGLEGRPEAVTYAILREALEGARALRECRDELWPVNQLAGWQISLPILGQLQPVGRPALRAQALARWEGVPRFIDTEIANLKEGLRAGYVVPRMNVQAVLEQLDGILSAPEAESPLLIILQRDSTPEFRTAIKKIVRTQILPAVHRYRTFLATAYLPHAREREGVSAMPNGAACYRGRLRYYTTLTLEPEAVRRLGLEQMAKTEQQMRAIAERRFGTADLAKLLEKLRTDPEYTFRDRAELIGKADSAVKRAKAAMSSWFGRLPKTDFILDPCQPFEEKSGCPGSYVSGTADGSRPGRYRVNAGDPTAQPRALAEAIAFHEGIPGHHLQVALGQERPQAHAITKYFFSSGFVEGWALYAEALADEMGLYSSDLDRMGRLSMTALRAARLVVDPGIHVFGWSRQQAIDYMLAHTAESRASVESEVDRYIIDPGQATAYIVGRREIEGLREAAQQRLGSEFDIREFHDRVLENGGVPLTFLRHVIERWIAGSGR
jgi:uncharacterized protein (DUF885 family)